MEAVEITRSNRSSIICAGAFGDELSDIGDLLDLVWALEQGPTLVGVWGGTSERKRREMRAGRAA